MEHNINNKWVDCTGDVVCGDTIRFIESVFGGSYRSPKYLGEREIVAEVIKDSYGTEKQQHTFTLKIIESKGYEAIDSEKNIRRKGRNIYRNGTERKFLSNENEREQALIEKHERGDCARSDRDVRRQNGYY